MSDMPNKPPRKRYAEQFGPVIFLQHFAEELAEQLKDDQERWGAEWLRRPREGQESRIYERLDTYWVEFKEHDEPVPWLKIAGLAMIAWIREQYPEMFPHE